MPFEQFVKRINEVNLQPQMKTILRHLVSRGSISPMEALSTYSIYRLSSAIERLRKLGYRIETELKRDEAGHQYARYSLPASQQAEAA